MSAIYFWSTTILSTIILIVFSFIFCLFRNKFKLFYQPKCYSKEKWAPKERREPFWWFKTVIYYEEGTLLQSGGVDVVIYLRVLKYTIFLFTAISIIGLVVLLPTNYFAGENIVTVDNTTAVTTIEVDYSIAHVPQGANTMWVHLICTYVISLFVFYYVQKLYLAVIEIERMNPAHKEAISRTVMVSSLPETCTSPKKLRVMFDELFGENRVVSTHMIPDVEELVHLHTMRESTFKSLRKAMDIYAERKIRRKPTHKLGTFPFNLLNGEKVDSISYYTKELQTIDKEILAIQRSPLEMKNAGFVTFNSVSTAMQCAQSILTNDYDLDVALAPTPQDIQWHRFILSDHEHLIRKAVVYFLLIILFLFWSVPISFLSAFSNLQTIRKINALKFIAKLADERPFVKTVIEGVLPSLALNVFLVLLPFILKFIAKNRKFLLRSRYDRYLMKILWLFLILNVFLVSVVAGGLLDAFSMVFDNPELIPQLLAGSLPKRALYLHNYMIFEGFVGYSLFFLCRFDDFLLYKIKYWLASTEAERRKAIIPPAFDFPVQIAREQMILAVGLTYSCITPLLLPFCTCYFILAWFTAKYNFVFVHTPPFAGLRMTLLVIDRVFIALIIFQITMLGIFTLKGFHYGISLIALIILTMIYFYILYTKYRHHAQYLPLSECPKMPEQTENDLVAIHSLYMHPVLKRPEAVPSNINISTKADNKESFILLDSNEENWIDLEDAKGVIPNNPLTLEERERNRQKEIERERDISTSISANDHDHDHLDIDLELVEVEPSTENKNLL